MQALISKPSRLKVKMFLRLIQDMYTALLFSQEDTEMHYISGIPPGILPYMAI